MEFLYLSKRVNVLPRVSIYSNVSVREKRVEDRKAELELLLETNHHDLQAVQRTIDLLQQHKKEDPIRKTGIQFPSFLQRKPRDEQKANCSSVYKLSVKLHAKQQELKAALELLNSDDISVRSESSDDYGSVQEYCEDGLNDVKIDDKNIKSSTNDHSQVELLAAVRAFESKFGKCQVAHLVLASFLAGNNSKCLMEISNKLSSLPEVIKTTQIMTNLLQFNVTSTEEAWNTIVTIQDIEQNCSDAQGVLDLMWHDETFLTEVDNYLLVEKKNASSIYKKIIKSLWA